MPATNESVEKLLNKLARSLKTHITTHTRLPKKIINYFVQNIELDTELTEVDKKSDIRVTGIKLRMREIACALIDDYDVVPFKAADAVFDHYKGHPNAYDKRTSFRTTVYQHYEISRGCKPLAKDTWLRDMNKIRAIIPILLRDKN